MVKLLRETDESASDVVVYGMVRCSLVPLGQPMVTLCPKEKAGSFIGRCA